jgi:uncharacterized DUF497 family protein
MFEWDEQKAERNQSKHSVNFPFATRVFDDENRLTVRGRLKSQKTTIGSVIA